MKLIAISSLTPKDLGVLTPVHDLWNLAQIIQPNWSCTPPKSRWQRWRKSPLTMLGQRLQRPFYDRQMKQLDQQITALCTNASGFAPLDVPVVSVPHRQINSDAVAESIRHVQPDLMITSSCPLLKSKIFNIPRLGTLNIHWGIAPTYRGDHTVFWPFYYGDYENIGVTIHRIDDGIDTGPILAQGFPELTPDDTEATLYAKCAKLAADLLNTVLTQLELTGEMASLPARKKGPLFRERDRTVWHDFVHAMRCRLGQRRPPLLTERRSFGDPTATRPAAAGLPIAGEAVVQDHAPAIGP